MQVTERAIQAKEEVTAEDQKEKKKISRTPIQAPSSSKDARPQARTFKLCFNESIYSSQAT